jgi:hypothetical protein
MTGSDVLSIHQGTSQPIIVVQHDYANLCRDVTQRRFHMVSIFSTESVWVGRTDRFGGQPHPPVTIPKQLSWTTTHGPIRIHRQAIFGRGAKNAT